MTQRIHRGWVPLGIAAAGLAVALAGCGGGDPDADQAADGIAGWVADNAEFDGADCPFLDLETLAAAASEAGLDASPGDSASPADPNAAEGYDAWVVYSEFAEVGSSGYVASVTCLTSTEQSDDTAADDTAAGDGGAAGNGAAETGPSVGVRAFAFDDAAGAAQFAESSEQYGAVESSGDDDEVQLHTLCEETECRVVRLEGTLVLMTMINTGDLPTSEVGVDEDTVLRFTDEVLPAVLEQGAALAEDGAG